MSQGLAVILGIYNKKRDFKGRDTLIPTFFDEKTSLLLIEYLAIVSPLEAIIV